MVMDSDVPDLGAVFSQLHSGLVPVMSCEDLARGISSSVLSSSQASGGAQGVSADDLEVTALCLTLVRKIFSRCSSEALPPDVREFYQETLVRLMEDAEFAERLVCLLSSQDRLLSHLTAKCVTSSVIYRIWKHGDCVGVWMSSFTECFLKRAWLGTSDAPLWVLTHMIKGILRGDAQNKAEILRNLLAPFQEVVASLFSELLLQDEVECLNPRGSSADLLCALMDLMEVLTSARHGVSTRLQTLALLRLSRTHTQELVRRRALLLVKRSLLRRAGDDLGVARGVLEEAQAGWLRELRVDRRAGGFGGGGGGNDQVTPRAVSLILIRSLEIQTQHGPSEGSPEVPDLQHVLLQLLDFLQQRGVRVEEGPQRCSWIMEVLVEQDDDLMEALRALSVLYSHHRSSDVEACTYGCNPHCHFILLLQTLSFDHSVLLDFLISSETCFLEYLVLSLKHLRDHWQDFCRACTRIQETTPGTSGATRGTSVPPGAPAAPLVDYESSEEEQEEELESRSEGADSSEDLLRRIMRTLSELQTVILRLNSRGLFPYTPTSLLKLLSAVLNNKQY